MKQISPEVGIGFKILLEIIKNQKVNSIRAPKVPKIKKTYIRRPK